MSDYRLYADHFGNVVRLEVQDLDHPNNRARFSAFIPAHGSLGDLGRALEAIGGMLIEAERLERLVSEENSSRR